MTVLGNNNTREDRMKIVPGEVSSLRDFAERLSLQFNNKIQTEHFGNTLTVSIEGIAVWFFPPNQNGGKPITEFFFTHLSDIKQQEFFEQHNRIDE